MASLATAMREEINRAVTRAMRSSSFAADLKALRESIKAVEKRLCALERECATACAPSRSCGKKDRRKLRFAPETLVRLRHRLGVSQEEMAGILGVSANSVWQWEAGRTKPRAKVLARIRELRKLGKREARKRLRDS